MINSKRLTEEFCSLAAITSPSFGEREMADMLTGKLIAMGFAVAEDNAGKPYNGNAGNLLATLPGEGEPLLFSAHMDTVMPCENKKIIVEEDGLIHSDGTTVLGSDDVAGLVEIFEAIRSIQEDGKKHRSLELLLSIGEEFFLKGSLGFDFSKTKAKEAYILDVDGVIGHAVLGAPTGIRIMAEIYGKAAHAAMAPETGINAVCIAAEAIAKMPLGRLDEETTANIGIIKGGESGNIVPGYCFVEGETRSLSSAKAEAQMERMRSCFEEACEKYGGRCEFNITRVFDAYSIPREHAVVQRFVRACEKTGIESQFGYSCGGSDNNNFAKNGITGIVLACGMTDVHGCQETCRVSDMTNAARIVEAMMTDLE